MNFIVRHSLLVFLVGTRFACERTGKSSQQNLGKLLDKKDLPRSNQENKVHFYLYTRVQEERPIVSDVTDPKLFSGAFDPDKPTIVIIPGYINTPLKSQFANTTRKTYLSEYDGQVLIVFWDAEKGNYTESRSNITNVAVVLTQFLRRMVSEEGLDLDETPVMGHSLGAHIAGTAGKLFKGKIRTVIGLDPANLLFIPGGKDTISPESGQFVQIVHTSNTADGLLQPMGHVDFYVNGDLPPQPGCEDLPNFIWSVCSHLRAFFYYAETFKHNTNFLASKCSSCEKFRAGECDNNEKVYLGQNTTRSARGKFFLRTRGNAPYGLAVEGSKGEGQVPQLSLLNATEENSVHFWLVNRQTRKDPIKSNVTDQRLFNGAYSSNKPTIVLIPGYDNTPQMSPFVELLEEAFLKHGDYELIVIYWDAATADYRIAVDEFVNVGRVISQFLSRMENEENMDLSSITLIGHGCGAHIGGIAGRFLKGKIKTLVGLDASSPMIKPGGYNVIDQHSAEFVMLIHTSASVLGILQPLGHVDFYPNTGLPPQPGCEISDYMFPVDPVSTLCSHERAIELYAESIENSTAFPAIKCTAYDEAAGEGVCKGPTKVYMGHNTPRSARGIYYLKTRRSSPYGYGITKE